MKYHERVESRVLDRPSAHSVSFVSRISIVSMMAPFEWRLTGTWATYGVPGDEEHVIALLPLSSASNHDRQASALQLMLLKPGARANTTAMTYLFQINLGSHVHALERVLPNVRIEAIRRHRAIFASFRQHFANQVQAWLNDVEDDAAWRDAMLQEMREGEQVYTEDETGSDRHDRERHGAARHVRHGQRQGAVATALQDGLDCGDKARQEERLGARPRGSRGSHLARAHRCVFHAL